MIQTFTIVYWNESMQWMYKEWFNMEFQPGNIVGTGILDYLY